MLEFRVVRHTIGLEKVGHYRHRDAALDAIAAPSWGGTANRHLERAVSDQVVGWRRGESNRRKQHAVGVRRSRPHQAMRQRQVGPWIESRLAVDLDVVERQLVGAVTVDWGASAVCGDQVGQSGIVAADGDVFDCVVEPGDVRRPIENDDPVVPGVLTNLVGDWVAVRSARGHPVWVEVRLRGTSPGDEHRVPCSHAGDGVEIGPGVRPRRAIPRTRGGVVDVPRRGPGRHPAAQHPNGHQVSHDL